MESKSFHTKSMIDIDFDLVIDKKMLDFQKEFEKLET